MQKRNKHIALFFSFLIAVGFVASGYHYHTHRYLSDDVSCDSRITSGIDNCLFCEGVFSFDIPKSVATTDLAEHPVPVVSIHTPIVSGVYYMLPGKRAPPFLTFS